MKLVFFFKYFCFMVGSKDISSPFVSTASWDSDLIY